MGGGCCAEAEIGAAGVMTTGEYGDAGVGGDIGLEGGMEGGMAGAEDVAAGGEGAGFIAEGEVIGGAAVAETGSVALLPVNGVDGHIICTGSGNDSNQNRYPAATSLAVDNVVGNTA